MIRIYLTHFEYSHFLDLSQAMPAVFREKDHDSAGVQREVKLKALESVIGFDYPRVRIGEQPFEVYGGGSENVRRWA